MSLGWALRRCVLAFPPLLLHRKNREGWSCWIILFPKASKVFSLNSRPLLRRMLWCNSEWVLPPSPCQSQEGYFLALHSENLVEFLEVKPMRVWGSLGLWGFLTLMIVHSISSNSSNHHLRVRTGLWFQQHLLQVSQSQLFFWTHLSSDFKVVICPATSILWLVQENSLIFSFYSFSLL